MEAGTPRACVFCAIARGEHAAHVVLEHPLVVAFLDARPVFKGHTLVVPRAHVETLDVVPVEELAPLFGAVQRVMRASAETGLGAGTFVAANNKVSQSVPHLHVHVVPRSPKDGLRGFFWPRQKYASEEEMAAVAGRLRQAIASAS